MNSTPDSISPDLLPNLSHDVQLLAMIEKDEGFREDLYKDSHELYTIGIGFCLDRRLMPREVAMFWLDMIIDEIIQDLSSSPYYDIYQALDKIRQFAVVNMCYQMGVAGVCRFKNMWRSLKQGNFEEAAHHALDSQWYRKDTPNRAMRVASVIRSGTMEPYK